MRNSILIYIKLTCLMIGVLVNSTPSIAQVKTGIGTKNPLGIFHVDGKKDNGLNSETTLTLEQKSNDFIITNDGLIGVGNIEPKVGLDLRSSLESDNSAIALGFINKTANFAGKGAVRFNKDSEMDDKANTSRLEVSDGVKWNPIYIAPKKAMVYAKLQTAMNIPYFEPPPGSGLEYLSKKITNWYVEIDETNSYDSPTGVFTAPRDGNYTFTVSVNTEEIKDMIDNGALLIFLINNVTQNRVSAGSLKYALSSGDLSTRIAGTLVTTVRLLKNQQVFIQIVQNVYQGTLKLRIPPAGNTDVKNPSAGFNNLTIIEN